MIKEKIKKNSVLFIAFLCAGISAFFVKPSMAYFEYIDFGVLSILFSLMLVVAGFQKCNVFLVLAQKLLQGEKNRRAFVVILVMLPFFTSMFITNDVALITFVPFTIVLLTMVKERRELVYVIVLQTIAANLGSMATPFGNPQNLYLYTKYGMKAEDFFQTMGMLTLCAMLLLLISTLVIKRGKLEISFSKKETVTNQWDVGCYALLFILCLLSVLQMFPYWIALLLVVGIVFGRDRELLKKADYGLLATFVCFFVFSGNMGKIPVIQDFLGKCMEEYAVITAIVSSQFISNVPSAVLLSNFTENPTVLLLGTNLGGLGTLIASLASLISFQFYNKEEDAKPVKYLGVFTGMNLLFLGVLFLLARVWNLF